MPELDLETIEYNLLMSSLDVSVSKHLLDGHFTVVWANERYYDMFGYTKEEYEALFHNQCDLYYKAIPEEWDKLVDYVTRAFSGGGTKYSYVCRMRHKSGKLLWIKLMGNLTGEVVDGFPVSYSVMVDITEQMQLQMEHTVTYNNLPGLIAKFKVTDDGFKIIDANQKYYEVFPNRDGYMLDQITPEMGLEEVLAQYGKLRQGHSGAFQISPVTDNGRRRLYLNVTAECIDWEDDCPIFLLIYSDVTKLTEQAKLLKQKNAELEYLAYVDPVTGGMNRTRFNREAGKAIRENPANTFALACLNLQKFKLINDLAGKAKGNDTLRHIHDTLQEFMTDGEFIARDAADNYTLLLRNGTDDALTQRLKNMVKKVNRFNAELEYKYYLYFTAGIYRVDDSTLDMIQIQDRAQVARQEIRKASDGLCTCRFYSDLERLKLKSEKDIENRMEHALESGEFIVYLQPKRSLKNGSVVGAEALVRWQDPGKGLIAPDHFIPLFERNGFITRLDLYIFESVCRILRGWLDQGLTPVPVSVNLSRVHFSDTAFIKKYAKLCEKHQVPPSLLEIEVTETVVFNNPEIFSKVIDRIHEYGFRCSMDDFGSGYSSLNVLKDLPVDALKLDRAFFSRKLMNNKRECDVVSTVIELAQKLEMGTVAEGVETRQQEDFLRTTGCDMIQGFVFSRPLPVADFEKLLFDTGRTAL